MGSQYYDASLLYIFSAWQEQLPSEVFTLAFQGTAQRFGFTRCRASKTTFN
jgi:hypothetical protein